MGRPTKEVCPICDEGRLVEVTFVFGAKLPPGGAAPAPRRAQARSSRRAEPVLCYEVEVCPACAWHHLMRKYPAGGRKRAREEAAPGASERGPLSRPVTSRPCGPQAANGDTTRS